MAEDFTGYDLGDPGTDLTITPTKIAVDTCSRLLETYVWDDKGAGHFGDFEHLVTAYMDRANTGQDGYAGHWGVSNGGRTLTEIDVANDGFAIHQTAFGSGKAPRFYMRDYSTGNLDNTGNLAIDIPYYLTIERSGTTLTCKIYSDAARTVLVDTLTIVCAATTFQYVLGYLNREAGVTDLDWSGYTENLDLQEVVAPIVKRRRGRMSYGLKPARIVRPGRIGV